MKAFKNIITGVLTLAILGGATMGIGRAVTGSWDIRDWGNHSETEQPTPETPDDNGGAIVSESASNGIKVMSAEIPVALYAENGISPQAETAYTLTATITPDSATDKSVDWEIAFKNPSSSWATDKIVTDYVTVTPTSDGALTANVECLQAFGEKIVVKVISRDNPTATATCTIDYAQKITGATLKFGEMPVNLGGTTDVKWQINANGEGFGGVPFLSYTFGEVYTLKENVTDKSITLVNKMPQLGDDLGTFQGLVFGHYNWKCNGSDFWGDITSSGIIFDRNLLERCDFVVRNRLGETKLTDFSMSDFLSCTSTIQDGTFADVVVAVTGTYGSYEYTSLLNISEFVNTASVTGVSLDNSTLVF